MSRTDDMTADECDALERALLIGLARQRLPATTLLRETAAMPEEKRALAGLAILAQRRRFVRPAALQRKSAPRSMPDDARPIIPMAARKAFAWLVEASGKRAAAMLLVEAALGRTSAYGLGLHPFDLPRLTPAIKPLDRLLGPAERAYFAMLEPEAPAPDAIDAANWLQSPRAARVDFLRRLRQAEPDRARELLQACWAGEPAIMRSDLLDALAVQLSAADRPFVEEAAADRAQTVRQTAAMLLAMLPGTPAHEALIDKAVSRFAVRSGKIAAMIDPEMRFDVLLQELECLTLDTLAQRLGVATADLVRLADIAEPVAYLGIMVLAARSHRIEIVMALLDRAAGTPWDVYATTVFPALTELPLSDRLALLPKLGPLSLDPFPEQPEWSALWTLVGGVLPVAEAGEILASLAWQNFKTACLDENFARRHTVDGDLAALAALMPTSLAARFAAEIADLRVRTVPAIQAFAAYVSALDAAMPSA